MPEADVVLDTTVESHFIPRPFRVLRTKRETHDVFTLELKPEDGSPLSFRPGQFNMMYVHGIGEVPISISGNPAKPETLVHTVRAVGGVTFAVRSIHRGDILGIRGPYGSVWPIEAAVGSDLVVVAGGIGLAPLRPVIYEALARRQQFGKLILLYGTREPEDIIFEKDLEEWRARFDFHVFVTVDRAIGNWKGHVGVVTGLLPKASFDPANTLAMICGPEVMMRFTAMEFLKLGVDPAQIYFSMERNMKCGIGLCGHCQFGPYFVCREGPVFPYPRLKQLMTVREI
ncbi:MAG TPA: FAD/NAD(P)-binding protein [Bacteroidota bacterium]|nr:FAD/NAD(P)-binding protein [Bacteroidota bacterium]